MKKLILLASLTAILASAPLCAAFIVFDNPVAPYTTMTSVAPLAGNDGDIIPSLTMNGTTATFSIGMELATVPGTWGTWGSPPYTESETPRVLWSLGLSSIGIDFTGAPIYWFGFEAEPEIFDLYQMTALFYSGQTLLGTISREVHGDHGARLFAAWSDAPITSVVFGGSDGFAIAQLRWSEAVPEPATIWLVPAGLLLLASRRFRRRS